MKKTGQIALVIGFLFSGCAALRPVEPTVCEGAAAYQRGVSDAERGLGLQATGFRSCPEEERPSLWKRYREGYAAAKARPLKPKPEPAVVEEALTEGKVVLIQPPAPTWVCEVEASSKIFTGVGPSLEEATRSAKETCGAHFQASFCHRTDCKQSL